MVARHALFQPTRPLRGATGRAKWYTIPKSVFQPTRPLRGATAGHSFEVTVRVFQPTRPLRGATKNNNGNNESATNFNPRAPCGARRNLARRRQEVRYISTHAPLAGRDDCSARTRRTAYTNFNPRAPCGARLAHRADGGTQKHFNPRAPCGARRYSPGSRSRM